MNYDDYAEIYLLQESGGIRFVNIGYIHSTDLHKNYHINNPHVLLFSDEKMKYNFIDTTILNIRFLSIDDNNFVPHIEATHKTILELHNKGYRFFIHNVLAHRMKPYKCYFLVNEVVK